jgi:hypothetical protein
MYEIRFDDQTDHVLAVASTLHDALVEIDRVAETTAAQLGANGEGHKNFMLALVVWDAERAEVVARCGIQR